MAADLPTPKSLIGCVLRRCKGKQRTAYLRGFAAEVLIAHRIMGPVGAGESIGIELFGDSVSPTPILNIVKEIESGIIPMTEEKLRNVVMQDEGAIKFLADNPWLIDVSGKSAPAKRPGPKPRMEIAPAAPMPAADEKPSPNIPATPKATAKSTVSPPSKKKTSESSKSTVETAPQEDAPQPTGKASDNQPDWAAIAAEHERHSKQRPPVKVVEESPLPKFVGPRLPENGSKATRAENEAYQAARKIVLDEYITNARSLSWDLGGWDGYGDPMAHATKIE